VFFLILQHEGKTPRIDKGAFLIGESFICGDITVEESASIWPGVSIRGDLNSVTIGKYTNIQDNSTLHLEKDKPLKIGSYVTVGHGATLHGCTIGDRVLVGIGAIVLNNVVVEEDVIIGAGSLVPEGKTLKSGFLYIGTPAQPKRELSQQEKDVIKQSAVNYTEYAKSYGA
jgi:carbonic anhydrase/acetyltransferase-like protein (isoleucine patch superfamily)